jgi:hypothetical protein
MSRNIDGRTSVDENIERGIVFIVVVPRTNVSES